MKKNFRTMMLAMATLGLFSCSDKLADDAAQSQTGSADGFVAFQINNVGAGTRATADNEREGEDGGYDAGEAEEYAITTKQGANVAFFFDEYGKYMDKSYLQLMSGAGENKDENHAGADTEKVYSARIIRKSGDTDETQYYCVLILNADPATLESFVPKDLNELMEKEGDGGFGKYDGYLTMSNSVYVDESNNEIQGPAGIKGKQICKTWEEAQKNKVTIHVERVVAKFGVTFNTTAANGEVTTTPIHDNYTIIHGAGEKDSSDDPRKTGLILKTISTAEEDRGQLVNTPSKWGIHITGWDINAKETSTYWVKNLNDGSNMQNASYPKAQLSDSKTMFGKNWALPYNNTSGTSTFGWNDVTRVRSYWAVDPHYNSDKDKYPRQYREAADITDDPHYYYYSEQGFEPVLSYIPYESIAKNYSAKYAPENTFGDYSDFDAFETWFMPANSTSTYDFAGNGYRWTNTHILVAAQLLLGEETENPTGEIKDKFCFGGEYWTEEVAYGHAPTDAEKAQLQPEVLIQFMVKTLMDYYSKALYSDEEGTPFNEKIDNLSDYFELEKANIQGGDGRRMLKRKLNLYTKNEETGKYESANKDLDEAVRLTTVQHFSEGKMYYAIPIEHMVAIDKDDKNVTKQFSIGSYGVVRNHWYKVNVSAINKPGTPVDDPTEEIVPNDDPKEVAYIAFQIVVIPWHVINQNVEF